MDGQTAEDQREEARKTQIKARKGQKWNEFGNCRHSPASEHEIKTNAG